MGTKSLDKEENGSIIDHSNLFTVTFFIVIDFESITQVDDFFTALVI